MAGAIAEYLDRLDRELRVNRAPRRRLLAEVEDHLRSSAQELGTEDEAVERFGAAALVARRFAHAVAATSARRSANWVALAFGAYLAALGALATTAGPEFTDFPQGAPSALTLQVAAVAVFVSLVRRHRWKAAELVPEERLRLLANGAVVGAAALATGLALEVAIALTRPAGVLPWGDLAVVAILFAVAVVAAVAAAVSASAAAFRSSTLAAVPGTEALEEPAFARRWALACTAASVALVAVVLSQTLVLGLVEALLVLCVYAALGRPLGLRARPLRRPG